VFFSFKGYFPIFRVSNILNMVYLTVSKRGIADSCINGRDMNEFNECIRDIGRTNPHKLVRRKH
jgi:hypothetical protein